MPVLMRCDRLHKAGAFARWLAASAADEARILEYPVCGGWRNSDDVTVEHHKGEDAVAVHRMTLSIVNDGLFFPFLQPVVTRSLGVVLVGLAIALAPACELARAQLAPAQQAAQGNLSERVHMFEEVHHGVSLVGRRPCFLQSSPSSFFVRTSSSVTAAMTSSLRLRRASSCSTLWVPKSILRERGERSKAAAPFSKKVFCQL